MSLSACRSREALHRELSDLLAHCRADNGRVAVVHTIVDAGHGNFLRADVDLCLKDPGFDVDLVVTANMAAMARLWTGDVDFEQAVRAGGLRVEGARELVRAFPRWLLLSHFAVVERPAHAG
jgi:hypothetical protein